MELSNSRLQLQWRLAKQVSPGQGSTLSCTGAKWLREVLPEQPVQGLQQVVKPVLHSPPPGQAFPARRWYMSREGPQPIPLKTTRAQTSSA